jgi:hypothetical protein
VAERWAQLTYTSFDTGIGRGGWQVKEIRGVLTAEEEETLRSRIVTSFEPIEPLPQFPSPEDIGAQPRRLVYGPLDNSGSYAYWHAVQSGLDGTGRPGNVFSHVVLDRHPGDDSARVRPIDSWRRGWLAPFGQPDVVSAALGIAPPLGVEPGAARSAAVEFLLDPTVWRIGVFGVLLDAVAEALRGGRPVVLVVDDPDEAALWVSGVSAFLSPGTSRRLSFSLFERATGLDLAFRRGTLLAAVPRSDSSTLNESQASGAIVIDSAESPSLGDLGGADSVTVHGSSVPVTAWSSMAQVVLQDPDTARLALARIDEVSEEVGDVGLSVEWPLAMTVATLGDRFADAREEAAAVLRDSTPARVIDHDGLWSAMQDLTEGMFGSSTGEVWRFLEASAPDRTITSLASVVYVGRALRDLPWLTGSSPAPAPSQFTSVSRLETAATEAMAAMIDRLSATERRLDDAVAAVRLVDFLVRSGLSVATGERSEILLEIAVAPVVVLDGVQGPRALVMRSGPLALRTARLLRDVVASQERLQTGPIGAVLLPDVLSWLYPEGSTVAVDPATGRLDCLDREYVIQRARDGDVAGAADLRPSIVREVLERGAGGQPVIEVLGTSMPHWSVRQVLDIESIWPGTLPGQAVCGALSLRVADEAEMLELALQVSATRSGEAFDAADFRLQAQKIRAEGVDRQVSILSPLVRLLDEHEMDVTGAEEVVVAAATAAVVLSGRNARLGAILEQRLTEIAAAVDSVALARIFDRTFETKVLGKDHVPAIAEIGVRGLSGFPVPFPATKPRDIVARSTTRDGSRVASILLQVGLEHAWAATAELLPDVVASSIHRADGSLPVSDAKRWIRDYLDDVTGADPTSKSRSSLLGRLGSRQSKKEGS